MDNKQLQDQLQVITQSTASLLTVIEELRDLATTRLENIENELKTSTRQLQQSIMILAELATTDNDQETDSSA